MATDINGGDLIQRFVQVTSLCDVPLSAYDIEYETLPAPHARPKQLPSGKMAVYVFCLPKYCLKVGKVGPKSHARFISQHYLPNSCQSNLAKSLLSFSDFPHPAPPITVPVDLNEVSVAGWMQDNITRHHFYLSDTHPREVLSLLEVFLQCALKPVFERG